MNKKIKEEYVKLIDKYGLNKASKLSGLSKSDLAVKSGVELDNSMAYSILEDLISNNLIPNDYKGFRITCDKFTGIFEWVGTLNSNYHGEGTYEVIQVYATPFWEGDYGIPVDIVFYEILKEGKIVISYDEDIQGSYNEFIKSRSIFDSVEDLLTWYKHFYLPKVYESITENLLNRIREDSPSQN